MEKETQDDILDAISNRNRWEDELRIWYAARHRGQGRSKKPYTGAPDLHFPLCDSLISRTKPFYVQQLYMSENIASFRPLFDQDVETTEELQAWYDYQLKQHSNFEEEIFTAIDQMLVSGRGIIGVSWDTEKNSLCFCSYNPLYFVVPDQIDDIQRDAQWVLQIDNLTEGSYKLNDKFNQDKDFLKRITGASDQSDAMRTYYEERKACREGLTYASEGRIIVWNLYTKEKDGILVETISPSIPRDDKEVIRDPFTLPYNKGVFKDGKTFPFFSTRYEIKDKGWYSPRGIIEQALPHESSLTAMWNAKHEFMDFACRPNYEQTQPLANTGNIKIAPGDVLPFGVKLVENPSTPIAFGEEMQNTRAIAEYLIGIPDVGANAHLSGPSGYGGEKPTAEQIKAISGIGNQQNDIHGRIFKMDMAKGLHQAWSILDQYARKNLTYFIGKTSSKIDPGVFSDESDYEIELNVSADSWNKEAQMQKASMILQMFSNSPYADGGAATKKAMDGVQPGLSRDLYRDPMTKQLDEAERQNEEIVLMLNNFSVQVKPFDDDKSHLNALDQFFPVRMQEVQSGQEKPPTPQQAQAFSQHTIQHLQALQQKKDPAYKQFVKQLSPMLQILSQIAPQGQQQAGVNGVAQPPPAPMANGAAGGAPASPQDQDKPSQILNALANLAKAGVQLSPADYNIALAKAGLPPVESVAPTAQHLNTAKAVADAIAPPQKNVQTPKSSAPVR